MSPVRKTASAAAPTPTAAERNRRDMLAKLHIAKKDLALGDDAYRDALEAATGKRSAAAMTSRELADALDHFKTRYGWQPKRRRQPKRAGTRRIASGEIQGKARALWLALYHLGCVRSPEESALDAFCKRQTGAESLRWIDPARAARLIEALKDWAARDAGVHWPDGRQVEANEYWRAANGKDPEDAPAAMQKAAVIEAQWRLIVQVADLQRGTHARLDSWLHGQGYPVAAPQYLAPDTLDELIEQLGTWLRRCLKAKGVQPKQLHHTPVARSGVTTLRQGSGQAHSTEDTEEHKDG